MAPICMLAKCTMTLPALIASFKKRDGTMDKSLMKKICRLTLKGSKFYSKLVGWLTSRLANIATKCESNFKALCRQNYLIFCLLS